MASEEKRLFSHSIIDTVVSVVHTVHMEIRVRAVPPTEHKALKRAAVDRGISLNALMLEMIAEYVKKAVR